MPLKNRTNSCVYWIEYYHYLISCIFPLLAYAYAKQSSVKIRVARIFNTYGPRMHMNDGRVVSNFILQALQNDPITVSLKILVQILHLYPFSLHNSEHF